MKNNLRIMMLSQKSFAYWPSSEPRPAGSGHTSQNHVMTSAPSRSRLTATPRFTRDIALTFIVMTCSLLALPCPPASVAETQPSSQAADTGTSGVGPYFLRLVDNYGIENDPYQEEYRVNSHRSRLSLAEQSGLIGHRYFYDRLVENVRKYGLSGHTVFGTTASGWFIVDLTPEQMSYWERTRVFDSRLEWNNALVALGIPADPPLLDPDQQASTRPATELRPQDYVIFRNFLGLSDTDWEGTFLLTALGSSLALGAIFGRKPVLGILSFPIGFVAGCILMAMPGEVMCFSPLYLFPPISYGFYRFGALFHRVFQCHRARRKYRSRAIQAGITEDRIKPVRAEIKHLQRWVIRSAWDSRAEELIIFGIKRLSGMGVERAEIVHILRDLGIRQTAAEELVKKAFPDNRLPVV